MKQRWWRNPLAIRFPGINPDRFLDQIVPFLAPLFRPSSVAVALLLMVIGLLIAVTHLPELAENLRTASLKLMTGQGLFGLLAVISITKIVHEVAHAVVCKIFGGDVLEMGIMFLVGTPCLYCDVSDAWLLPQRWKRVLISAAGILAELTIASLASIVWLFAADGQIRDLCVIVMMVCSVTTILFNGNPLLRYDGYFILSDLVGIPNLATEATAQVRAWLRQIFWGRSDVAGQSHPSRFVGVYGIASGIYRVSLYSMIGWMLYSIAKQYDLDGIFAVLMLIAFGSIGWRWVRWVLKPRRNHESASRWRPTAVASGVGLVLLAVGLIPLPRSVIAPMSIQPAESQKVFVARPGRIVDSLAPGSQVDAGTVIARIQNLDTERELAASRAERDRLKIMLASLRQSRAYRQVSSARIESVERAYTVASKHLALLEKNAHELVLTSPCRGQVYCERPRTSVSVGDHQAEFWTDCPMEHSNRGAWLETGTTLCLVGDPAKRDAIVLLRQQEIELIRAGQTVTFRLADQKRGQVSGRVIGVASSPAEGIGDELAIAAQIEQAAAPHYLVRVRLDQEALPIPIRTTGRAKIYVESASIAERISRFLADEFG
jgi:putative peptide zinc metalloprotease protein